MLPGRHRLICSVKQREKVALLQGSQEQGAADTGGTRKQREGHASSSASVL